MCPVQVLRIMKLTKMLRMSKFAKIIPRVQVFAHCIYVLGVLVCAFIYAAVDLPFTDLSLSLSLFLSLFCSLSLVLSLSLIHHTHALSQEHLQIKNSTMDVGKVDSDVGA